LTNTGFYAIIFIKKGEADYMETAAFIELAKTRRSIRRFEDKDITKEQLTHLIEAARSAPSAGNCQPWYFYIIKNKKIQAELKECAYGQGFILSAPACITVCTDSKRCEARYGERGKTLYVFQDTAAAIQNILLCAKDMGLGSCWVGAFDEPKAAQILNLPENLRPVALIAVGYADQKFEPQNRRPLEEIAAFII
jgi:nitroreductase